MSEVKVSNIEQAVTQDQSCRATEPLQDQHIKCVSPMTFSQKLYKYNALEVAQEYEQAIEENSLEKVKKLLDKLVRLNA